MNCIWRITPPVLLVVLLILAESAGVHRVAAHRTAAIPGPNNTSLPMAINPATPTLGNYPPSSVAVSANVTVTANVAPPSTTSVATILNDDGSVNLGSNGSFDMSGFRMEYGPNLAPRFVRSAKVSNERALNRDSQVGVDSGVNANIFAFAVMGTDLYVGGNFTSANVSGTGGMSIPVNYLAKFDTTVNTWSAIGNGNGNGVNGPVYTLAVIGTDLYVGGQFTRANVGGSGGTPEVPVNNIVSFDTTTGTWSALGNGNRDGVNNSARALAVMGSDLYVGGYFTSANVGGSGGTPVVPANRVAKFDTSTRTWSALGNGDGNGLNNQAGALAVAGNDLYVGGAFTSVNFGGSGSTPAVPANYVAKFNTSTRTWSALTNGNVWVTGQVNALAVVGTDLYIGGSFASGGPPTPPLPPSFFNASITS